MTPSTLVRATQGLAIPGLTIIHQTIDAVRMMTIYIDMAGDMVVGFGGTRPSLRDILLDLFAFRAPWKQYRAHAGAVAEMATLWHEVNKAGRIYRPTRVWISGHSQGGAHAVLAGLRILEEDPYSWVDVVTFGAMPALSTGSTRKADLMLANNSDRASFTHYRLSGDPMAAAPWWAIGLGFPGHIKTLEPGFRWPDVGRHDPGEYIKALEKGEMK